MKSGKKYAIAQHVAWLTLAPLLLMVIGLEAFFCTMVPPSSTKTCWRGGS